MKNTFVKVLSFVMALMMVVGTFGTLAVFADAHEHTKGKLVSTKDATCVAYGYSTYLCGECGEEWETDVVAPSKNFHEYVDVEEVKASCLTDAISAGKKCKHCNDVLEGCKPSEGTRKEHYFVGAITPATCDAPETLQYTCNICNQTAEKIYADGEFMAAQKAEFEAGEWNKDTTVGKPAQNPGHAVLTWNVVTAPSQTATECLAGLAEGYCEQCKTVIRTAEIPAIHTYESKNKDNIPCIGWDADVLACSVCGEFHPDYADAKKDEDADHTPVVYFANATADKKMSIDHLPTDKNGNALALTVLSEKYGVEVGSLLRVEPTCVSTGKELVRCECGEIYWAEIEVTGHDWKIDANTGKSYTVKNPVNCTDAKVRVWECKTPNCGHKVTETIIEASATGHNWVKVAHDAQNDAGEKSRPATCVAGGYEVYKCANELCTGGACGVARETKNYTNALGHSYGAPYYAENQAENAICENGVWEKKCTVCNGELAGGIVNMSTVSGWTAPKCVWDSQKVIAATCHTYEKKYTPCKVCGNEKDVTIGTTYKADNHVYPTAEQMKAYANGDTSNEFITGWVSNKAAKCNEAGTLIVKCIYGCGDTTITYAEGILKDHDFIACDSCVGEGHEHVYYNYIEINGSTKTAKTGALAATCSTVGYKNDGKVCVDCKHVEKPATVIPVTDKKAITIVVCAAGTECTHVMHAEYAGVRYGINHTHKSTVELLTVTAATCKVGSKATFNTTCCGIIELVGEKNNNHTWTKPVDYKAPTCVADGHHAYIACSVCDVRKDGSMVVSAEACGCVANYAELSDAEKAAVELAHEKKAANDDYVISMIPHDFKKVADGSEYGYKRETCTEAGRNSAYYCANGCGDYKYGDVVYDVNNGNADVAKAQKDALLLAIAIPAHYGKYMQTFKAAAATCTSDAIKAGTYCTVCQKDAWVIAGTKTEHATEQFEANLKLITVEIPEADRKAMTYDEYKAFRVDIPGFKVASVAMNAEGSVLTYTPKSYTGYVLKDCTEDGCIVVRCKNCTYYETTFVEAKNTAHKYPANFTEDPKVAGYVSCKDTITESKKCADCDNKITQTKTEPTGHFTTKGVDGGEKFFFDYACNKINDYKAFKCDTCGVAYTELVKTLVKHNLVHLTKNATCTEEGFEIIECKNNCGLYETVNKTLPTTNNTGKHSVDHAATVVLERVEAANGVDGYVRYICGVCKQTTEDVLKADAALNTTISAGSEIVAAGSEIKIDVKVSTNAPAFSQLFFAVNAADFELVDVELVADFADANVHADLYKKNDTVGFVLYTENNAAGETVYATLAGEDVALVTLTLAVKQYATAGNIAVSAQYAVIGYEENGAEKNATFADNGKALTLKIAQTGDLNADGIIGVVDLQALIPQITKLVATGSYDAVADVNKDGTVDQFDIAALRQFMKNGFTTAAYLEMIGEDVDAAIAALKITDVADSIRFAKFVDDKLADKYETFLETRSTLNEYIADLYLEYATPASEQAA